MSQRRTDLDATLGENLRILTQAMGDICRRGTLEEATGGRLSTNQFAILKILARQNDLTAGEFARILDISSAAVSKNIDRLVELDLVRRDPHPHDRRRAALALQPDGRDLLERHEEIAGRKMGSILERFTEAEKVRLLENVQRVIYNTLSRDQDTDLICFQCSGHCGDACVIERRRGTCGYQQSQGA